jgi:hypothetical protein
MTFHAARHSLTLVALVTAGAACKSEGAPASRGSETTSVASSATASAPAASARLAPPTLPRNAVEIRFVLPEGPIPLVDADNERAGTVTYFYEATETIVAVEAFGKDACATVLAMKPEPQFPVMEPRKVGDRDALYVEGVSKGRTGDKASVGYTVCTEAGPVQIITMAMKRATLEPADRERALAIARSLTVVPRVDKAPDTWVAASPKGDLARASFPAAPELGTDPLGTPFAGLKLGGDAALLVNCWEHRGDARALGERWFGVRRGSVGANTIASETQIVRDGGEIGVEIDSTRTEAPKLRARHRLLRKGGTFCSFQSLAPPDAPRDAEVRAFLDAAGIR